MSTSSQPSGLDISLATHPGSRWTKALEALSDNDRLQLQSNVPPDQVHYREILEEVLGIAVEKKQLCIKKAWKFKKSDGKVVIVRDLFEKIVVWVQKFKEVGDVAVSYDPGHAALPWAAVRFLLKLAIADTQTFGAMVEGIEKVAMLVTRCGALEQLYVNPGHDDVGFEEALIGLYVAILKFECSAILFYGKNTAKRILSGVIPTSSVEDDFKKITEAQMNVDYCAKLIDAKHQRTTEQNVGMLRDAIEGTHTKLDTTILAFSHNQTRLETILRELEGPIVRSASMLQDYADSMKEREREELLQWLSTIQYRKHHKAKRNEFLESSCEWLLSSREYMEWKKSSTSSILWLHGIAGSGKSVLVSSVIEDIHQEQSGNPNAAPIAYFYCSRDAGESERANPEEIMRSILEQVASNTAELPIREPVVEAYMEKKRENRGLTPKEPLTLDETTAILLKIFEENPATIVIDALDECDPGERHNLLSALDTIITESASLVRVFVSSRDDGDLVCQLEESPNVFIRASDNSADITKYVQEKVNEAIRTKRMIKGKVSSEMKELIVSSLIRGAQGMFRWVSLQIQQLCDIRRVKHEEDIKYELGRLPKSLQDSYDVIYDGILTMARASKNVAIRTMKILLCAQRRLTPAEMLAAVTVDPLSGNALISSEADILDVCCNMVFLDEEVSSFRFAHLSVREYLERRSDYAATTNHIYLMDRCLLAFLCESGNITPGSSKPEPAVQQTEAFHGYATMYWPYHCQLGATGVETSINLEHFIGSKGTSSIAFEKWISLCKELQESELRRLDADSEEEQFELEYEPRRRLALSVTTPPSILFVACIYGLGPIIRHLLPREGIDWNQPSYDHKRVSHYPLVIAAEGGYTDIVEMLLRRQPDFYLEGMEGEEVGSTALASAVHGLHFYTAKLLLESGVNKNARVQRSQYAQETPLNIACQQRDESMVQLLLSHGAYPNPARLKYDRNWADTWYTPLYDACQNHSYGITKLLIEAGTTIENPASSGNMLHVASKNGDETFVELLLANGVDVKEANYDSNKRTPLHYAAEHGHVGIIKLLVQYGVQIDAKDSTSYMAIHYAIFEKRAAAVEVLIALGTNLREIDDSGRNLLHVAAAFSSSAVVRLLIQKTLRVDDKDTLGWTALHHAVAESYGRARTRIEVAKVLIEKGIDIEEVDQRHWTALHVAASGDCRHGHEPALAMIQFLLDQGASIEAKDSDGNTPLCISASTTYYARVELLVARGANIEVRNYKGETPLQLAQNYPTRTIRDDRKDKTIEALQARHSGIAGVLVSSEGLN